MTRQTCKHCSDHFHHNPMLQRCICNPQIYLVTNQNQFGAVVLCGTVKQRYSDYPKWGPALPLLACLASEFSLGTSFTAITKKRDPSAAKQSGQRLLAHSQAVGVLQKASVGDGCGPVCIFLSLPMLQSPSFSITVSVTPRLFFVP